MTKGPDAFRTISEAAEELGVPQHVLRFWETRFSFIRPMKRAGGRRFYRPQDLALLRGIRVLLHDEGYTIKGVQKLHRDQGVRHLLAAGEGAGVAAPGDFDPSEDDQLVILSQAERERLEAALEGLIVAKAQLDTMLTQG